MVWASCRSCRRARRSTNAFPATASPGCFRRDEASWTSSAAPIRLGGLPYAFSDLTARVDVFLDPSRVLEVSGVLADNHVDGRVFDSPNAQSRRWGTHAARVTLDVPQWGGRARYTIGGSRYSHHSPRDAVGHDDAVTTGQARGTRVAPSHSRCSPRIGRAAASRSIGRCRGHAIYVFV